MKQNSIFTENSRNVQWEGALRLSATAPKGGGLWLLRVANIFKEGQLKEVRENDSHGFKRFYRR